MEVAETSISSSSPDYAEFAGMLHSFQEIAGREPVFGGARIWDPLGTSGL